MEEQLALQAMHMLYSVGWLHDQAPTVQANFGEDVLSLISVMEDLENPFEEEGTDLQILYIKEIVDQKLF